MQLLHNVFFTLKDKSAASVKKLIDACRKHLTVQPGIVSFACGAREQGLTREVNDKDWDVGLHILFKDRASHDAYQVDARHEQFVAENKNDWAKARVFDSLV